MIIQQIPPAFVSQSWPQVSGFLKRSLDYAGPEYSIDQLQMMLVRGEHALLIFCEDENTIIGAMTVSIEDHPGARIAFVSSVGGRCLSTEDGLSSFSDWCRRAGCTLLRGAVRPSVARLLRQKFKFEQRYIIVEHAL